MPYFLTPYKKDEIEMPILIKEDDIETQSLLGSNCIPIVRGVNASEMYNLQHIPYANACLLNKTLNNYNFNISSYMKTSIKTLLQFLPFIKNTFNHNYHNGFIEGNNNFIKVIKRIAFGFRSFRRFKARIMICKGLLKIKKIANA